MEISEQKMTGVTKLSWKWRRFCSWNYSLFISLYKS